jgi:type II secretory pathway pseudopilin PulG
MKRQLIQRPWHRLLRKGGTTIVEVIVTVAILGILSSVVIHVGWREWRREQVNSVVLELASWLQTVRRGALKGNSCQVTIRPAEFMGAGGELASINNCGTVQPLRLSSLSGIGANRHFKVAVQGRIDTPFTFTFTPAGTIFVADVDDPLIVISVTLGDISRCVQLDGLLGALDLGVASGSGCAVGGGI